jgi:multidrug efflux pump subunit AcrA (membrane-fusion protein)
MPISRDFPIRECGHRMPLRMTNSRARVPLIALAAALLANGAWRWNGASKPDLLSPGVLIDGVVREGDGTMTVWVTADRRRFVRRTVKIGQQHDGYRQILGGVHVGELVATEGALFLSNALATASR